MKRFFFFFFIFNNLFFFGQFYPPPVGQPGTTAIYKDSSVFISWAVACKVTRGLQDISNPSLGYASAGDSTFATGKAQVNGPVSLGDGGFAICTFNDPVRNGPGADFAVFENGFDDTFLELAFVEVSSDGINYYRFPSHSLSDTTTQTSSFGTTDATKINNLAGKYRGGYGLPFDLQELSGKPGLNINSVTHILVRDVIGSINSNYATRDSYNNKVNDPWPTAFPQSGFDLDAIGVINSSVITFNIEEQNISSCNLYPNPVSEGDILKIACNEGAIYFLEDMFGKCILSSDDGMLTIPALGQGIYILRIFNGRNVICRKILVH
jgi:hypothetical protein